LWGGSTQPFAAASGDGQDVVVVASGKVYRSYDGGCSFEGETFSEEYGSARDAQWGEGRAYVLVSGESTGAIYSSGGEEWQQEAVFGAGGTSGGVSPDSFRVEIHNGDVWVGVAGARPSIELWHGTIPADDEDTGFWTQFALAPEIDGAQTIAVRAVEEGGALWLVSTHSEGKRVWRVAQISSGGSAWASLPGFFESVLGPVREGSSWVAVLDGRLSRVTAFESTGVLEASEGAEVDWTCLQGGVVCTLPMLYSVSGDLLVSDPGASLEPSFDLSMLEAPETGCLSRKKADECIGDWVHFGAEAGLLGEGSGLSGSLGCGAVRAAHFQEREIGIWLLVWGAFMLWIRRRGAPGFS